MHRLYGDTAAAHQTHPVSKSVEQVRRRRRLLLPSLSPPLNGRDGKMIIMLELTTTTTTEAKRLSKCIKVCIGAGKRTCLFSIRTNTTAGMHCCCCCRLSALAFTSRSAGGGVDLFWQQLLLLSFFSSFIWLPWRNEHGILLPRLNQISSGQTACKESEEHYTHARTHTQHGPIHSPPEPHSVTLPLTLEFKKVQNTYAWAGHRRRPWWAAISRSWAR